MQKHMHKVPENSSFFQGNTGQFFTRNFGKNLSYKVNNVYSDSEADINVDKYRVELCKKINTLISNRLNDGGTKFHTFSASDIVIKPVKLANDEDDICGNFIPYPPTGICTKDGCNTYFDLHKGRNCNHKETDQWEQFTFLAFCDICGRTLPLHYMSNIGKNCKRCKAKESMWKLVWAEGGKDIIKSYKVQCIKCGYKEDLFFYKCNHEEGKLSGIGLKKKGSKIVGNSNFRAVPARANAILHPYVISIPDVSQENELQESVNLSKATSEAFISLFGYEIEESKLYSPEFRDILQEKSNFWDLPRVESIIEDTLEIDVVEIDDIAKLSNYMFSKILTEILREAHSRSLSSQNKDLVLNKFGIKQIQDVLTEIKSIKFDENDLQGLNLINSRNSFKKESPTIGKSNYEYFLENYGLEKVYHFSNLSMIQVLLGVVEGSTRRNPLLFKTIDVGYPNEKPTVYVRKYNTEGILFQLSPKKILEWLYTNKKQINISDNIIPPKDWNIFSYYRKLLMNDSNCESAVKNLLHTYSHMLIQQSSVNTGLDIQSISEIIYPSVASILLYSTNSINMGGLEYVYDYHLDSWFSMMKELAQDCPQDPACMVDENGACNSCSYLPEFVCCNFNNDLDRSTLVGGSERYIEGYFK